MKIEKNDKYITLTPEEGMMLRNDDILSDKVYTPLDAKLEDWSEVTIEEAEAIKAEIERKREEEEKNRHTESV